MKKIIILSYLMTLMFVCFAQQKKEKEACTSSFFTKAMNKYDFLEKYREKYICFSKEVDSLLNSDNYNLYRIYDNVPIYKDDSSIIIYIRNNKEVDWSDANNNCAYYNNIILILKKYNNKFLLEELIILPLNQGIMGLDFIEINTRSGKLYLCQYGGNRFGTWGTEMEFENNGNDWLFSNSKFFTTVNNLDNEMKKIIWSKVPEKKIPINQICFTDIFDPEELGQVMDGVYSDD